MSLTDTCSLISWSLRNTPLAPPRAALEFYEYLPLSISTEYPTDEKTPSPIFNFVAGINQSLNSLQSSYVFICPDSFQITADVLTSLQTSIQRNSTIAFISTTKNLSGSALNPQSLILFPHESLAVGTPVQRIKELGFLLPELLTFAFWEYTLRCSATSGSDFLVSRSEPTRAIEELDFVSAYFKLEQARRPALATNLDDSLLERSNHRHALISAVVQRHLSLFADHSGTLIPFLDQTAYLADQRLAETSQTARLYLKALWWIKRIGGLIRPKQ